MSKTLFIDRALRDDLWKVPIELSLIKNKNISDAELRLYLILLGYARMNITAFPGRERLAEDLGCSVRSVDRLKLKLKKHNLLEWKQKKKEGRLHNIYMLLKYTPITSGETNMSPVGRHTVLGNNTNIDRKEKNSLEQRERCVEIWDNLVSSEINKNLPNLLVSIKNRDKENLEAYEGNLNIFIDALSVMEEFVDKYSWFGNEPLPETISISLFLKRKIRMKELLAYKKKFDKTKILQ